MLRDALECQALADCSPDQGFDSREFNAEGARESAWHDGGSASAKGHNVPRCEARALFDYVYVLVRDTDVLSPKIPKES
eukprot:15084102-Alexandrium_andersonii.AAC.1